MLKVVAVIIMYLVSFAGHSQTINNPAESKSGRAVQVVINKITSDKGSVRFALYDSEKNFNERKPLQAKSSAIRNGRTKVTFTGLQPGIYSVVCYHDVNSNEQFDFQENGMPLEDYGSTKNVFRFGPPRFSDSKFELRDKDLTFEIKFM